LFWWWCTIKEETMEEKMRKFSIENILKNGFPKLVYKPELLKVQRHEDSLHDSFYGLRTIAGKSVFFTYQDDDILELSNELNYLYCKRPIKYAEREKYLHYQVRKSVNMRKKPNKNEYTDATLNEFNSINLVPDLQVIHDYFTEHFVEMNEKLEQKFRDRIVSEYGSIYRYDCQDSKTKELKDKIEQLEKQLETMENDLFAQRKQLTINFVEGTNEINDVYKKDLLNNISEQTRKRSLLGLY
jgi:hypothetical protein